jgi:hypothetical protein
MPKEATGGHGANKAPRHKVLAARQAIPPLAGMPGMGLHQNW